MSYLSHSSFPSIPSPSPSWFDEDGTPLALSSPYELTRANSSTCSNQGDEGTCWAHSATRMILRFIKTKTKTKTKRWSKRETKCSYFYHVDNLRNIIESIVGCERNPTCDSDICFTSNEIETALVYAYIYKIFTRYFGCCGQHLPAMLAWFKTNMIDNQLLQNLSHIRSTLLDVDYLRTVDSREVAESIALMTEIVEKHMKACIRKLRQTEVKYHKILTMESYIETMMKTEELIKKGYYVCITIPLTMNGWHTVLIENCKRTSSSTSLEDVDFELTIKNSWGDNEIDLVEMESGVGLISNKGIIIADASEIMTMNTRGVEIAYIVLPNEYSHIDRKIRRVIDDYVEGEEIVFVPKNMTKAKSMAAKKGSKTRKNSK